jgi:hypothetical protein
MKNSNFFFVLLCLLIFDMGIAQSIAFVGISNDGLDDFSFVAVSDIPANTVIHFTDEEYRDSCNGFYPDNACGPQGEDYLTYTSPGAVISSGTVIVIQETSPNVLEVISGPGSITRGGTANYSQTANDVLHAFLASDSGNPFGTLTEVLASFNHNTFDGGSNAGDNPIGDHPNAIVFEDTGGTIFENADFMAVLRPISTNTSDLIDPIKYTTSTSDFALSTDNFDAAILPVEFTSFTAQTDRAGVLLKWQTAKEENNDYFQIEHSIDGRNFSILGKVEGNGTTNNFSNYTFLDEKPAAGINYYRLKQVDYDGAFEYSDIASAQFGDGSATVVVYPNPFSDQLTLSLPTGSDINDRASNPVLKITNLHGQVVRQEAIVSTPNHSLNLGDLVAGTYILQVYQDGLVRTTQRLVKF